MSTTPTTEQRGSVLPTPEAKMLQDYKPKHKIRFVTATALFDGHDASINIMRRLLQARGVEVIHLGHTRSAKEIVDAALQEDAQAIAISSYQGGHMELFKYMRELLDAAGATDVQLFGGGGGVFFVSKRQRGKVFPTIAPPPGASPSRLSLRRRSFPPLLSPCRGLFCVLLAAPVPKRADPFLLPVGSWTAPSARARAHACCGGQTLRRA